VPPDRRVRPPRGATRGRTVAGGPRRHGVVLPGLHDLRLPARPRVRRVTYVVREHAVTEQKLADLR
jgi:hypothetical protein